MAITFHGIESNGNLTEYAWEGGTGDAIVGTTTPLTSDMETKMFVVANGGAITIVEISLNFVGTSATTEDFVGTKDHIYGSAFDAIFTSTNTNTLTGLYKRWDNNAGIIITKGSHANFTWANSNSLAWSLSVIVRSE